MSNCEDDENDGSYSIIIHTSNTNKDLTNSPTKPLWRKREIVRHERTVHYTTIDEDGAQQVYHMRCRPRKMLTNKLILYLGTS